MISVVKNLVYYNGMNVCRLCGQVINYNYVSDYCSSSYRVSRKSVYRRKHHLNEVLNNK